MAYLAIVDDDADFALAIATALRTGGHEVETWHDTKSAIEGMQKRPPDLLILDVMFPESSSGGFELARELRHFSEHLERVPILMLTAINERFPLGFSTRDIDDSWLPVADFLEKPVDIDVLRERVSALLQKAESNGQVSGGGKN